MIRGQRLGFEDRITIRPSALFLAQAHLFTVGSQTRSNNPKLRKPRTRHKLLGHKLPGPTRFVCLSEKRRFRRFLFHQSFLVIEIPPDAVSFHRNRLSLLSATLLGPPPLTCLILGGKVGARLNQHPRDSKMAILRSPVQEAARPCDRCHLRRGKER